MSVLSQLFKRGAKEGVEQGVEQSARQANKLARAAQVGLGSDRYATTSAMDMAHEIFINNLLSNPSTHLLNGLSNLSQVPMAMLDNFYMTLTSRFNTGADKVFASEVIGDIHGMFDGFGKTMAYIGQRSESRIKGTHSMPGDTLEQLGIPAEVAFTNRAELQNRAFSAEAMGITEETFTGRLVDGMGAIINLPTTALNQADLYTKIMHASRARARAAYSAVAKGEYEDVATAMRHMADDPDVAAKMVEEASYYTFMGRPNMPMLSWITDIAMDKLPGARWIVPFKRTIANLFEQTVERSPLVLASPTMARRLADPDPNIRATAQARLLTGITMLTSLSLLLGDKLTGAAPREKVQREMWEKANGKPFHFMVGDKQYNLEELGVTGQMLKVVAMYNQWWQSKTDEDFGIAGDFDKLPLEFQKMNQHELLKEAWEFVAPFAEAMGDMHWGANVAELFNAIHRTSTTGDAKFLMSYVEKIGVAATPIIGAQAFESFLRQRDNYVMREAKDPGNQFMLKVEKLRETLWPTYDAYGEEMRHYKIRGPGYELLNGPYDPDDKLNNLFLDLGVEFKQRSKFMDTQDGTPAQASKVKLSRADWDLMHQVVREGAWDTTVDMFGNETTRKIMPSFREYIQNMVDQYNLTEYPRGLARMYLIKGRDTYNKNLRNYMRSQDKTDLKERLMERTKEDAAKLQLMIQKAKEVQR